MNNILLIGNPNVGKTSLYNIIADKSEHTGNWSGKTVDTMTYNFTYKNQEYSITDLPGVYSLEDNSYEEKIAINYVQQIGNDIPVVIIDGTNLERGLFLFYEVKKYKKNAILIITMKDILDKTGIQINVEKLGLLLDTKVLIFDINKIDRDFLLNEISVYDNIAHSIKSTTLNLDNENIYDKQSYEDRITKIHLICSNIANEVRNKQYDRSYYEKKIDVLLFNRATGIPIFLLFMTFILWLSIVFSNYFQEILYNMFNTVIYQLYVCFEYLNIPSIVTVILIGGGVSTSLFVASVMIPPMLIFFPMFMIIEEVGLIPRISFNLDGLFSKFNCNGKNVISIMLGFGCNCVGVTSTRIFENEKSRKIAILINNFIPCNGRLPMLFLLVLTFLADSAFEGFIIITTFIGINILLALIVAYILSKYYYVESENFIYEIPSYKRPNIKNIVKISLVDKASFVLGKALTFSFVAGIIVFIMKSVYIGDNNILITMSNILNPLGQLMGLSGVILVAFIIGISANEIVLPIVFMIYTNQSLFLNDTSVSLSQTLGNYGFTYITAICMIIFSLNHYPCIASLSTIKKETNSTTFTLLCAIVPLLIGSTLCIFANIILHCLQSFLFF